MPRKPQSSGTLALASFDNIFNVSATQTEGERIVSIPLADLYPPDFHPFQVNDDEAMIRLAESVKEYGVREPGIARPRSDGGYELICGNRRKRACELAGIESMPVIIRELSNDCAAIIMVDSNLERREKILPSERAWAYKIMMEALNHNGIKGEALSYEIMVEKTGVKKSQIFRFIRLTELIVTLLDMVDANRLAFNPAVELSYLTRKEQTELLEIMAKHEVTPSLSQAQRLKKLSQAGELTPREIDTILSTPKNETDKVTLKSDKLKQYFPATYTPRQMEDVILKLLERWRSRGNE